MLSWGQYICYFVAGLFYYMALAAAFSAATGYSTWHLLMVLITLVLAGYASGMSLVVPRVAAVVGGISALLLLIWTAQLALDEPGNLLTWVLMLPVLVAVCISALATINPQKSPLTRQESMGAKMLLGILIAAPALLATYAILVWAASFL